MSSFRNRIHYRLLDDSRGLNSFASVIQAMNFPKFSTLIANRYEFTDSTVSIVNWKDCAFQEKSREKGNVAESVEEKK